MKEYQKELDETLDKMDASAYIDFLVKHANEYGFEDFCRMMAMLKSGGEGFALLSMAKLSIIRKGHLSKEAESFYEGILSEWKKRNPRSA